MMSRFTGPRGRTGVPRLDLFRVLNASRLQIFLKLRWPASIPSLLASLRITSTLSLVGAVVGDYVAGGGNNLGNVLNRAHQSYDTALMMAVVLVATMTGIVAQRDTGSPPREGTTYAGYARSRTSCAYRGGRLAAYCAW